MKKLALSCLSALALTVAASDDASAFGHHKYYGSSGGSWGSSGGSWGSSGGSSGGYYGAPVVSPPVVPQGQPAPGGPMGPMGPPAGGQPAPGGQLPDALQPGGPQGQPQPQPTAAALDKSVAHMTVKVPADAKVFLQNQQMTMTGPERRFVSPELKAGARYVYSVKVELQRNGKTLTKTTQAEVAAGQQVEVVVAFDEATDDLVVVASR